jgi:signal peptidase I
LLPAVLKADTAVFLDVTAELLSAGYRVRFRAHGASMHPAIRDGDTVTLEHVDVAAVQAGDILLYRQGQRPFAHRVVQVQHDGRTVVGFVLRGDAKTVCDAPVRPDQILGRVLAPQRRGLISYFFSRRGSERRHHALAPRANRQA